MECILIRWEARTRTLVRQIAKSADFVRTWPYIWRHNLMTWHDIDLKFSQSMSNWSTRWYCNFRVDPPRFTWVIREKPWGVCLTPLQVRGLMQLLKRLYEGNLKYKINNTACVMRVLDGIVTFFIWPMWPDLASMALFSVLLPWRTIFYL